MKDDQAGKFDRRDFVKISGGVALPLIWGLGCGPGRKNNLIDQGGPMEAKIGKGLKCEFPRSFVPYDADVGDPAVVNDLFDKLDAEPMDTREQLEAWLLKWSELSSVIEQEGSIRYIKMTCQTDDPEREQAYLDFVEKIEPVVRKRDFALMKEFLASPALKELDQERYGVLIRDADNQVSIFREENIPLMVEEHKLSQQYQKRIGSMTVEYEGKEQTLQQMARYLERQERPVRKEVWEKVTARRLEDREELDRIFDEMLALRARIAKNAGFDNFRDYAFRLRGRFDYGVAECEAFHDAVEQAVVPLYRELEQKRKQDMGVDDLRPWDLKPDPKGRPPLTPFTTAQELIDGCQRIFSQLDPQLGERFKFLVDHDLLDLESRKGKAPGAYSSGLEELRVPFIFANSVGMDNDVNTMLHESGHAFHTLECRNEPLLPYRHAPIEFAEVASMSMEFLGSDHLGEFYSTEDAQRSREDHLASVIWLFCWIATVDAFQQWIYTHPGHTDGERAEAWVKLRERFGGIEDWSGYEDARRFEWHRQLHIFEIPFYYIEYGIAELGALQIWKRAREDAKVALRDYRAALRLGGSRPLPRLFEAAGIKFDMTRATIEPLTRLVKTVLDEKP